MSARIVRRNSSSYSARSQAIEENLDTVIHEIDLAQATEIAANMLAGRTYGRTVIRIARENQRG